MALATLNGADVISARISMPRVGAWTADLVVDGPDAPSGGATLKIDGGLQLTGTCFRSGAWLETGYVRLSPGTDGLRKTAKPKHYTSTNIRIVLGDLLANGSERLSATADTSVLTKHMAAWTTIAQPIGNMIALLVARATPAGTAWRMLADGTLWVGAEQWPDSGLTEPGDFVEMDQLPHEGKITLGIEAPRLLPGTTLGGRKLSYVEHTIAEDRIRTVVWIEG